MGIIQVMKISLSYFQVLICLSEIFKYFVSVYIDYGGVYWYWQYQIFIFGFGVIVFGFWFIILGFMFVLEVIVDQCIECIVCFQIYGIIVVIVVVIGIVFGYVFFVLKIEVIMFVFVGFNDDGGFVYEFYGLIFCVLCIN